MIFLCSLEDGLAFTALNSLGKLHVERQIEDGMFFSECGGNRCRALKFEIHVSLRFSSWGDTRGNGSQN